jgi:Arsenical resistance operon protein ArsD
MARSLPLQSHSVAASGELAGTVLVFDPAMCCPTGLCGPGVDPALLAIARDLRWLESQGVTVERHGLAQSPDVFVAHPKVTGLIQAFGDKGLPATLVNGAVLTFGKYPTRDELLVALNAAVAPEAETGGCCAPGSACDCG